MADTPPPSPHHRHLGGIQCCIHCIQCTLGTLKDIFAYFGNNPPLGGIGGAQAPVLQLQIHWPLPVKR